MLELVPRSALAVDGGKLGRLSSMFRPEKMLNPARRELADESGSDIYLCG